MKDEGKVYRENIMTMRREMETKEKEEKLKQVNFKEGEAPQGTLPPPYAGILTSGLYPLVNDEEAEDLEEYEGLTLKGVIKMKPPSVWGQSNVLRMQVKHVSRTVEINTIK